MAKLSSPQAVALIEQCRLLGFVKSELSGGVLVQVPTWQDFKSSLPSGDARAQIKMFHAIERTLEPWKIVKRGKHVRRWKIWHTGTIRIDGSFKETEADSDTQSPIAQALRLLQKNFGR